MREVQDLLAAHGEDMSALDFSGELMVEIAPPAASNPATAPNADRRAVWAGTSTVVGRQHDGGSRSRRAEADGSSRSPTPKRKKPRTTSSEP